MIVWVVMYCTVESCDGINCFCLFVCFAPEMYSICSYSIQVQPLNGHPSKSNRGSSQFASCSYRNWCFQLGIAVANGMKCDGDTVVVMEILKL